jgi:hypothetical protein
MNEFDQFMKHGLKVKNYIRYTDDFAIVDEDRDELKQLLPAIDAFLKENLFLNLHPKKIILQPFHRGVDFLGYVIFPHHRLVRTKTKKRMFRKMQKRTKEYREGTIDDMVLEQSLQSYLGVLSHADTYQLRERMLNEFWIY